MKQQTCEGKVGAKAPTTNSLTHYITQKIRIAGIEMGKPAVRLWIVPYWDLEVAISAMQTVRSLLRYSRLVQTNQKSGFEQGTDVRYPQISDLQMGDGRITVVADQSPGFGKFGGGAFGLAS